MTFVIKIDDVWTEIVGGSIELPDRIVSAAWVEGLPAEEREALGFVEIEEPGPPPEGQYETSRSIVTVNGEPVYDVTYEDIPPPPLPAEVPMYKVRKYLIRQGLKAAVEAHLNGVPGTDGEEAREDWEYAPNLVVNSPLALGAKAALNLTDEQYAAMIRAAAALA